MHLLFLLIFWITVQPFKICLRSPGLLISFCIPSDVLNALFHVLLYSAAFEARDYSLLPGGLQCVFLLPFQSLPIFTDSASANFLMFPSPLFLFYIFSFTWLPMLRMIQIVFNPSTCPELQTGISPLLRIVAKWEHLGGSVS